jgi:hypothetical protein
MVPLSSVPSCTALPSLIGPASNRPAQAWWQSLDERHSHQLLTGLVGNGDGIVKRDIVSASYGFGQNVSDVLKGIRPSSLKVGKLNSIRVMDKLVALLEMAVVPRHGPQLLRSLDVPRHPVRTVQLETSL